MSRNWYFTIIVDGQFLIQCTCRDICQAYCPVNSSLVVRHIPFSVLWFMLTIIHRSRRAEKTGISRDTHDAGLHQEPVPQCPVLSTCLSPYISFRYTCSKENSPCRGVVYLTVLCDRPYLVSLLFAVLLSQHLFTFLMFLLLVATCLIHVLTCTHIPLANSYMYSISFTSLYMTVECQLDPVKLAGSNVVTV